MKLFSCSQIHEIDAYTINNEPIASIDLMERAASALTKWFAGKFSAKHPVFIFAGPGNNGGDGIAMARLLTLVGYNVKLFVLESKSYSKDHSINIDRLSAQGIVKPIYLINSNQFPEIPDNALAVDALFGSGLSRSLSGLASQLVDYINDSKLEKVIAIDIPSGLFGENNPTPNINSIIKASTTLTLQFPKLSFFFPENFSYVGCWEVINIDLHPKAIADTKTSYHFITKDTAANILKSRGKFDHKGKFGHCLIVAGSEGMLGATILCAGACIKSGAGLVTAHAPKNGAQIIHQALPEVMVDSDDSELFFTAIKDISKYSAIGIGPGLGQDESTFTGFKKLLANAKIPMVIDADAINLLAKEPLMLDLIPENSILTPHVGEFNRLFGGSDYGSERLKMAINFSSKYKLIIVLKGAYTQVVCPDGKVFFNSTGNPGMATAGSGDVLTGIITSMLGQGYYPKDATILGVFIHGLAGDYASNHVGEIALTAPLIINFFGKAFSAIFKQKN